MIEGGRGSDAVDVYVPAFGKLASTVAVVRG
jgi:hypothetical protein